MKTIKMRSRILFLITMAVMCSTLFLGLSQYLELKQGGVGQVLQSNALLLVAGIVLTAILSVTVYLYIRLNLLRNLAQINELANSIADGNVNDLSRFEIANYQKEDEIGGLTAALLRLAEAQKNFSEIMDIVAAKDLTTVLSSRSEQDVVAAALEKMLHAQNETIHKINVAADNVAEASKAMLKSGASLSKSAIEQSGALEEITATVTEIAIQSKQISESSSNAKTFSEDISKFAGESNERMRDMLQSMEAIKEASNDISRIIKVIDEISFQTNILSLNASVEAARAGQEGKGFAVVAEEVRNLAGRSAKAAKETEELIQGTINRVIAGAEIAQETAQALSKILDSVRQNVPLIESISVATDEQYIGIEQMNQALEQTAKLTEKNSRFAEESAMASQELSLQAELLKNMVGEYKTVEQTGVESASFQKPAEKFPEITITAMQPQQSDTLEISLNNPDFDKY